MKTRLAALCAVPLPLSACVTHTWAPPPGGSPMTYDQQAAQRRLRAFPARMTRPGG